MVAVWRGGAGLAASCSSWTRTGTGRTFGSTFSVRDRGGAGWPGRELDLAGRTAMVTWAVRPSISIYPFHRRGSASLHHQPHPLVRGGVGWPPLPLGWSARSWAWLTKTARLRAGPWPRSARLLQRSCLFCGSARLTPGPALVDVHPVRVRLSPLGYGRRAQGGWNCGVGYAGPRRCN